MPKPKAFYDPSQDMYVVEFVGDPIFTVPDEEFRWSMFTHGVCTDGVRTTFRLTRIGITGRHLCSGEPTSESLGERLDQAIHRLPSMHRSRPAGTDWPITINELRCIKGVELLVNNREEIIQDLIASWRESVAGA